MFQYPITVLEIHRFMDNGMDVADVRAALEDLCEKGYVFLHEDFYALQNQPSWIIRRMEGNARAQELLQTAYRIAAVLYRFPFVRGVGISGSLSKDFADERADIDFFLITKANWLWIARSLLHGLKKLSFLVGKEDYYCMNYFIDEEALLIAEENIFTATEVVTLKPVCGKETMNNFFTANNWSAGFLPNAGLYYPPIQNACHDPWYKKLLEKMFSNRAGKWLNHYLMRVTRKRWEKKERDHRLNSKGDPFGLAVGVHFARPNPAHLQKKLLDMYAERLNAMEKKWGMVFDNKSISS